MNMIFGDKIWKKYKSTIFLLTFIIFTPTIIFIILANRFGLLLPRLNFDFFILYIFVVLASRFFDKSTALVALFGTILIFAIQLFFGLGGIYIDDPALVREYLAFAQFWPWRLIGFWFVLGCLFFVGLYFLIRKISLKEAYLWPTVLMLLGLFAADLGSRTVVGHTLIGTNPVTSSATRTIHLITALRTKPRFQASTIPLPMMRDDVLASPLPDRILSISVESFGLANIASVNEAIAHSLREELSDIYEIQASRHEGRGATISGELRELCNQKTVGTPTRADSLSIAARCLPKVLFDRGYQNLATHGNSGIFYNRYQMYPALGFTHTVFFDDMMKQSKPLPLCRRRAFEGICDIDLIAQALRFVGAAPKRYAHIMTLDTHFPLGDLPPDGSKCGRAIGVSDESMCLYVNQFSQTMSIIGAMLKRARIKPDVVYIFGDHPPPYAVAKDRNQFDRNHVPYFVLRLRKPA